MEGLLDFLEIGFWLIGLILVLAQVFYWPLLFHGAGFILAAIALEKLRSR